MLAKKPTRFMTNSQVLGRELSRKCDKSHEHHPLLDGRAQDAARYPPGLCRAICRGISKEKMLPACGITAMLSIQESVHLTNIDPEENHEREEVDIEALIRKIEGQAQEERGDPEADLQGSRSRAGTGSPGAPPPRPKSITGIPLKKLMEYKNKKCEISSMLAWDDLTHMKLDAGKVKEARAKEVGYIRNKRVYDKIPRAQALRNKWKVVQVRWIDINKWG